MIITSNLDTVKLLSLWHFRKFFLSESLFMNECKVQSLYCNNILDENQKWERKERNLLKLLLSTDRWSWCQASINLLYVNQFNDALSSSKSAKPVAPGRQEFNLDRNTTKVAALALIFVNWFCVTISIIIK